MSDRRQGCVYYKSGQCTRYLRCLCEDQANEPPTTDGQCPASMQPFVTTRSFELVCYGCGVEFDLSKFMPVKNRDHVKPKGGLWTSPIDSEWGWKDWCESEEFGDLSVNFRLRFFGRVYVVDSMAAVEALPWRKAEWSDLLMWPDYEAISDVDAIHVTIEGERATRYEEPSLYGWDCETVWIMNPACISSW